MIRTKRLFAPDSFNSFGDLLRYLRRRARMTQRDLAVAVDYSVPHICRLERNQRTPDPLLVGALFIPALELDEDICYAERLVELAAEARDSEDHVWDNPAQ